MDKSRSDATLVKRCLTGDGPALCELSERYGSMIKGVAFRRLQNEQDAEDVSQDVLEVLAFGGLERWDASRGSLDGFVWKIASDAIVDMHRKRARQPVQVPLSTDRSDSHEEGEGLHDLPCPETPLDEALDVRERQSHVHGLLRKLSPSDRDLLFRKFWHGETRRATAAGLGIAPQALDKRLQRALQRLKKITHR